MKVLVTGVNGQLGHDVMIELINNGHEALGSGSSISYQGIDSPVKNLPYFQIDITDQENVNNVVRELNPDAIIHCAAWTSVDKAEESVNYSRVFEVNVKGTENLVNIGKKLDVKFVYLSTDYVFDGQGNSPWEPDQNDFKPLNIYGESKLKGEKLVSSMLEKYFIVRVSWVFGINGNNFVKTMLNVGKKYGEVSVVNDQIGTPTYTPDLSSLLVDMIETNKYGYYHVTNEGEYISWYDFTKEIYSKAGLNTNVIPVSTKEYGEGKAKRPFNSRLDKTKLSKNGFKQLPNWKDALGRFIDSYNLTKDD